MDASPKPFSFKDAVMNSGSEGIETVTNWQVEDLELQENDVHKESPDEVPTTDFSDRVYGLIERSMAKTLIIKLLGRKIGYNALWKKFFLCRNQE